MVDVPYTPAEYLQEGFNCPKCGAFANQSWYQAYGHLLPLQNQVIEVKGLTFSLCVHCRGASYWHGKNLMYPAETLAPPPNSDMDEAIRAVYEEAAGIQSLSPRGAAALLRLCIQMLCKQLGKPGLNINEDIGRLVTDGLPSEVIQALDVVRVIGNNAVHPGQIAIDENGDVVNALFNLVNFIAERLVTQPRQIQALHSSLPPTIQAAITLRDTKAKAALPAPRMP